MSDDDPGRWSPAGTGGTPDVPLQPLRPGGGIPKPLWIAGGIVILVSVAFVAGVQVGTGSNRTAVVPSPSGPPSPSPEVSPSPSPVWSKSPPAVESWARILVKFDLARALPPGADCTWSSIGPAWDTGDVGTIRMATSAWSLRCNVPEAERDAFLLRLGGTVMMSVACENSTGVHGGDFEVDTYPFSGYDYAGGAVMAASWSGSNLATTITINVQPDG